MTIAELRAFVIHPRTCGWCEYPLEQLLAACDWATWYSRFVLAEVFVWRKSEEHRCVTYEREVRADEYDQPAWRAFYALPARDRRYRVDQAEAA